MNRTRKEEVVVDFKDLFSRSNATFIVEYKSLNVASMQQLRKDLRGQNASLRVTKARLMKKAFQEVPGAESFLAQLKQQVALVFAMEDVPAIAKSLVTFAKDKNSLKIVSGFFEEKYIDRARVEFLAALPTREVLLAQIAGTINEIIARIPRVIQMANEGKAGEANVSVEATGQE
jgi:large subunit ribosomal protein L10